MTKHTLFQDGILTGQTAVITGGGSGINLGIATRLAEKGADVLLIGRTPEKLARAAEEIARIGGGRAVFAGADVRNMEALGEAVTKGLAALGRESLDIVIAGAAGNFAAPAAALSPNGFAAVVDIDLKGTFHLFRATFEKLTRPGARLLAISAGQAFTPTPLQAHVCAAKAGVDILVKTLAVEWGPLGIRVNSIAPGPVADTEGMRRLAPSPEMQALVTGSVPLRRFASISEIADVALFLVSPAAAYVTGHVFVVDGGMSLGGGVDFDKLFRM